MCDEGMLSYQRRPRPIASARAAKCRGSRVAGTAEWPSKRRRSRSIRRAARQRSRSSSRRSTRSRTTGRSASSRARSLGTDQNFYMSGAGRIRGRDPHPQGQELEHRRREAAGRSAKPFSSALARRTLTSGGKVTHVDRPRRGHPDESRAPRTSASGREEPRARRRRSSPSPRTKARSPTPRPGRDLPASSPGPKRAARTSTPRGCVSSSDKAIESQGSSKPAWQQIALLARALGYEASWTKLK